MILVTGGAGFVGRHVLRALADAGEQARALVRRPPDAATLARTGCEIAVGDVTDRESLRRALDGVETVVHLVAIIAGRAAEFERVMVGGTAAVLELARAAGATRVVYVSALGTGPETKGAVPYFAAKWQCEQAVAASGLAHAILRPSFVFGPDGGALPRLLRIARIAPLTPVIGSGRQRIQPVWVDDLARAILRARTLVGERYEPVELGGPDVVDWNELWRRLVQAQGRSRPAVHLPVGLLRPQAFVLERLPGALLTRDQLEMLELGDNVVTDGGVSQGRLGLGPLMPLDEQLRRALAPRSAERASTDG